MLLRMVAEHGRGRLLRMAAEERKAPRDGRLLEDC